MFLQLQSSPFSNAQYELVVLHPEHFLLKGSSLTFYSHVNNQLLRPNYVVGHDRMLRQSPGTMDSPCFLAFCFDVNRSSLSLNDFLVLLNAKIKLQCYRRMGTMPALPEDIKKLMDKTIKLVDLIYWKPEKRSTYQQWIAYPFQWRLTCQTYKILRWG